MQKEGHCPDASKRCFKITAKQDSMWLSSQFLDSFPISDLYVRTQLYMEISRNDDIFGNNHVHSLTVNVWLEWTPPLAWLMSFRLKGLRTCYPCVKQAPWWHGRKENFIILETFERLWFFSMWPWDRKTLKLQKVQLTVLKSSYSDDFPAESTLPTTSRGACHLSYVCTICALHGNFQKRWHFRNWKGACAPV